MLDGFQAISCPLDPDEREHVINFKIENALKGYPNLKFRDPYDAIAFRLAQEGIKLNALKVEVEPWLLPAPDLSYLDLLTVENVVAFIDSNGCLEYANMVCETLRGKDAEFVSLIGVDHSISGGVVKFLSEKFGPEDLALVVLDSHFDAITPSVRCGVIQYDLENNPDTPFDPRDPYIMWRPESYNADSFLHFLVEEELVEPQNLVVAGVSDYPPQSAFEIDDPRIKKYLQHYLSFEKKGVEIIPKERLKIQKILKRAIKGLEAKYIYISIDVDIGSKNALTGARFLDYTGLSEDEVYRTVLEIVKLAQSNGIRFLGFDLMETDVFKANCDRTFEIEANLFKILARNFSPSTS